MKVKVKQPPHNRALTKLFCTLCPNMVVLAWTGNELLRGKARGWHTRGRPPTHRQTQATSTQIAKFMWPTWGPPGPCWPQVCPMLAPWTLLSENTWRPKLASGYDPQTTKDVIACYVSALITVIEQIAASCKSHGETEVNHLRLFHRLLAQPQRRTNCLPSELCRGLLMTYGIRQIIPTVWVTPQCITTRVSLNPYLE